MRIESDMHLEHLEHLEPGGAYQTEKHGISPRDHSNQWNQWEKKKTDKAKKNKKQKKKPRLTLFEL